MIIKNFACKNIITKNEVKKFKNLVFKLASVKSLNNLKKFLISIDNDTYHQFRLKIINSFFFLKLNKVIKKRLEKKFNKKLFNFPVKGVRIALADKKTHAPWHQDEGTWFHHKNLRNKNPFTIWIPIIASNENTLEVSKSALPLINHKRDKYKQAYIDAKNKWSKDTIIIKPHIGDGYIFSNFQPHRSICKKNTPSLRISIDFRFSESFV